MKKEKFLNFLKSKFFMAGFVFLGLFLFSNVNSFAQQGSPMNQEIAYMTDVRDSFAPGTAKYDFAQDALDYLATLEAGILANPNYLDQLEAQTDVNPMSARPMARAHRTVLANYTAAEITAFQQELSAGTASKKIQWILEANAY